MTKSMSKLQITFCSACIDLQQQGKGKGPMKADSLSIEDEACLWRSGVLGIDNPTSLNYTIFFLISQNFGTRGRQEHHQLQIEDMRDRLHRKNLLR